MDFERFSFQVVKTIAIAKPLARPFERWTIWNIIFKKSGFQIFPGFKWSGWSALVRLWKLNRKKYSSEWVDGFKSSTELS